MKKLSLVFAIFTVISLILFMSSCTNLFTPSKSQVSVILTTGGSEGVSNVSRISETYTYTPSNSQQLSTELQGMEHPWVRDIESLRIRVQKFSYKYSTGPGVTKWATPTVVDKVIDLVTLNDTEVSWLNFDVPKGAVIISVGFEISSATLTINGQEYTVTIPGNKKFIVLRNLNWEVKDDNHSIELLLDLPRIIVKIGDEYVLVPRIAYRWRGSLKLLWAIDGIVKTLDGSKPTELLAVALFEGTNTEATPLVFKTIPIRAEGKFYLGKHKPGKYTVVIYNNLSISYSGEQVNLNAQQATHTTFNHGSTTAHTHLELRY
ncbi:MAG: hypothetical protein ACK4R7_00950 [Fervidobacterium sp.]